MGIDDLNANSCKARKSAIAKLASTTDERAVVALMKLAEHRKTCGATHEDCPVEAFVVDSENRIVTTPAYMLGPGIKDVAEGIERCVGEVLRMVEAPAQVG